MTDVVSFLAAAVTRLFDVLVMPFGAHRTAGLLVLSMLTGAALTLLYRATANEARIRRTRDVFKARILEMRLYPDDLVLITRALLGALAAQGQYLRVAARPIVIVALIAVPVFLQIEKRYAHAPLAPGENTLVTARLKPGLDVLSVPTTLDASTGVEVDARSARAPVSSDVTWRVGVLEPGRHDLTLHVYDQAYRFPVTAERDGRSIGTHRTARSMTSAVTGAGLPEIRSDSPLAAVSVEYPPAHYDLAGRRFSWLALFVLGSFVGASVPALWLRVAL
ncbi:MAG TPA: hypothetical protein VFH88_09705 [Candidatus Krumholzibacteria bacterium]|nr:hypothetical protein [Candidatus Krumholzibacteria bacterium]